MLAEMHAQYDAQLGSDEQLNIFELHAEAATEQEAKGAQKGDDYEVEGVLGHFVDDRTCKPLNTKLTREARN